MKTEPTEALRLIEYSWYALPNATAIDRKDCIEAVNIAFREGQSSPKIKQLEWSFHGLYYNVKTEVGHYMILQGDEQCMENFDSCTLTHNGGFVADFDNLEEAKTYAQKHFEARVKECLIIEQV